MIVSEYEDFIHLDEIIRTYKDAGQKLNETQLLFIFKSLLKALKSFHDNNLVHGKINQKSVCYVPILKSF